MTDRRPNILWLMTDEQRTDSLGCYGSPWARTPQIDQLAAEGTLFRSAVTPAPVCIPARLSMLTGRYPHETGIWYNANGHGRKMDLLTTRFADAGYRTASFGKQHYCTANRAFQTEEQLVTADEVHYFHYTEPYDMADYDAVRYEGQFKWLFGGRFPESAERTTEWRSVDAALAWLDAERADAPFLLRVSFNGPHTPVVPPAPFDTLIGPDEIALPGEAEPRPDGEPAWIGDLRKDADAEQLSPEQVRRMRQCYYGEVAFLDQQFGRLLAGLRERGLLENTIIAFLSDHGAHLADYRLVQKQTFYEPSVRVPLVLWWPGHVAAGATIDSPVETLGVLPALLAMAGVEQGDHAAGRRLLSAAVAGGEPDPAPVFSEFTLSWGRQYQDQRIAMVRDGHWKLSLRWKPERCDGTLHDLEEDPHERRNLFDDPIHGPVRDRLAGLLEAHLTPTAST